MRLTALVVALGLLLAGCSSANDPSPTASEPTFVGTGFAACPTGAAPTSGKLASVQPLTCMDGSKKTFSVGAATGKPMIVNLWGSWCSQCGVEMPSFIWLATKAGDKFTVLGVDTEDSATDGPATAKDTGVKFANVFDRGGKIRRALGVNAMPATAFITADGKLAYVYRGEPLTNASLAALVKTHLGVSV